MSCDGPVLLLLSCLPQTTGMPRKHGDVTWALTYSMGRSARQEKGSLVVPNRSGLCPFG